MAEVKMKFTADTAQATKGIRDLKGSLEKLKSAGIAFGNVLKKSFMAITAGLTAVSAAALKGTKDIIDFAGEVKDISDSTGSSIKDIIILQEQFRQAGVDAGRLQAALATLNSKLQNPSTSTIEWLDKLGLSSEALLAMDPAQRFETVGKSIGNVSSAAERLAASKDLFGKIGADLTRLFSDSESRESAIKMLGQLPTTMNLIGGTLEAAGDKFDGVGIKWKQFFSGFASQLLGPIEKAAGLVESIDLTGFGVKAGMLVNNLVKAFKEGNLVDVIAGAFLGGLTKALAEIGTLLTYVIGKAAYAAFEWAVGKVPALKILSAAGGSVGMNNQYEFGMPDSFKQALDQFMSNPFAGPGGAFIQKNEGYTSPLDQANFGEFHDLVQNDLLGGLNKWADEKLEPLKKMTESGFKMPMAITLGPEGVAKLQEEMKAALEEAARKNAPKQEVGFGQNVGGAGPDLFGFQDALDFATEKFKSMKEIEPAYQKDLAPVVSSLGRIGGAAGETGSNVVNFQNKSLQFQRQIAINTSKMVGGATFA